MEPRTISTARLAAGLELILVAAGCARAIGAEVGAALAENDRCGHGTHGARQIDFYVDRLQRGHVDGSARATISHDQGGVVRVAGNRAFGQVAGEFAANLGTERALSNGVALVCLAGAGHLGRNGRWAEIAAARQVGSMHFGQGIAKPGPVAPAGGRAGRLNTTPIALGLPGGSDDPIILDCATSAVSGSSIKRAKDRNELLDEACLVMMDGRLSSDPDAFLRGEAAVLPFGGFKGFGIALFAEIASAILATGGEVPDHTNSLFSIYFSIPALMDPAVFRERFAAFRRRVIETPPIDAAEPVVFPGDRARAMRAKTDSDELPMSQDTIRHMRRAASLVGVEDDLVSRYPEMTTDGE